MVMGLVKHLNMLILSDLDFLRHFGRIELQIEFLRNNLHKISFNLITKHRRITIPICLELLKHIHEEFIFIKLIELVLKIGFAFGGG